MSEEIRRGFIVETNISKCICTDIEPHNVIRDDVDLDYFQWATEDYDHFVDQGKDGCCPKCNSKVTFDWHFVVTHREKPTEEETK